MHLLSVNTPEDCVLVRGFIDGLLYNAMSDWLESHISFN